MTEFVEAEIVDINELERKTAELLNDLIFPPSELKSHCPLDQGATHYGRRNKAGLGQLERLPTELLREILGYMTVETLLAFRRVCQGAMIAVDGCWSGRGQVGYQRRSLN
ncbi:hypothetical protein BDV96DRAFT_655193 [Lophiotrema nucula]|uniref:F-box domain-containing protein n=1 Tax=Lophiotrema nucula TaxID=690887 RepID=A0A6A5YF55_9PLEO|nr:hypothetical protein BDV96DRAFT_655193 [Lophiotrema nucula]